MDLSILRAAAAAHAGHSAHASHSAHPGHSAHAGRPPFVPPPHFMAMASASADAGLMGGLSSNHAQPGKKINPQISIDHLDFWDQSER
jgi:hypothetical protein